MARPPHLCSARSTDSNHGHVINSAACASVLPLKQKVCMEWFCLKTGEEKGKENFEHVRGRCGESIPDHKVMFLLPGLPVTLALRHLTSLIHELISCLCKYNVDITHSSLILTFSWHSFLPLFYTLFKLFHSLSLLSKATLESIFFLLSGADSTHPVRWWRAFPISTGSIKLTSLLLNFIR